MKLMKLEYTKTSFPDKHDELLRYESHSLMHLFLNNSNEPINPKSIEWDPIKILIHWDAGVVTESWGW
jgi:hypothetical protein